MNDTVEILLVEDNPNDVELALHAFKQHNIANKIEVTRDGEEALEYIFGTVESTSTKEEIQNKPKLILLDLKLPKIDGLEVLKRIKENPETKSIPVVMLTSSREDRDVVDSYKYGVNSYITKPVDFDQFTDAVKQIGYYWLLLNENPQ